MSILLDKLCITASSLRSIITPASWDRKHMQQRMYNASISTIRRIVKAPSEDNYLLREGSNMEDEIINQYFQDERYEKQKACERTINIGGKNIPFRALLDIYDTKEKAIIEIKYVAKAKVDFSNIGNWINNTYCKAYDVQAQMQMLCCQDHKRMRFLIRTKEVNPYSDNNKKDYFSEIWQKDDFFIERNINAILEYWEMLCDINDRFLSNDKQVLLHVYHHDEKYKVILGSKMAKDIEEYIALHKQMYDIRVQLDIRKERLIQDLKDQGLEDVKLGGFSITKYPKMKSFKYADIVRDKGILETLTEEELEIYTTESEEKYVVSVRRKKEEDLFEKDL